MGVTPADGLSGEVPLGYGRTNDFVGSETAQLGLRQIHLRLELGQVVKLIDRPDPTARYEHNRKIDIGHAKDFAQYLLRGVTDQTSEHKHQPMIPAIYLFTDPSSVELVPTLELPAETFGTVRIDKLARLAIWDGQHRVLGMHLAVDELAERLQEARAGGEGAEEDSAEVDATYSRLVGISVPLVITLTSDRKRVGAIFSDLNDKQKGMASSVVTRLDDRIVFNRVAAGLAAHELLDGLVDHEADYTTGNNPHWISLRDVAEVAKLLWLGYGGRWNDSREDSVEDGAVAARAAAFIELLADVFSDLRQVLADRTIEPRDLRRGGSNPSLLASATMVKGLAVAYHDLLEGTGFTRSSNGRVGRQTGLPPKTHAEIKTGFDHALPRMDSGKDVLERRWTEIGVFEEPWVAPTARGANVRTLAMSVMDWVRKSA